MTFGDLIAEMEIRRQWARARLQRDRLNRSAARVLLASDLGLLEVSRVPDWMIRANGERNTRHIDSPPGRPFHACPDIPAWSQIPDAVAELASPGDMARRLRAHGVEIDDPAAPRINSRIRGVCRILWLWALWTGHSVDGKSGGAALRSRWYHPDDVKIYWPTAWSLCSDSARPGAALAYLDRLCHAWSAQTGRRHAGEQLHRAAALLIEPPA